VNIPLEVHKQIMLLAEKKKVSVNDIVEETLLQVATSAKDATGISSKKNKIARKLPVKTDRMLAIH
jgi:hypothetical protein